MHPSVELRVEGPRGCGYRRPGLYLISDPGRRIPCGWLPIPLCPCQRCDRGIKFSRGWQWIDPEIVMDDAGLFGACEAGDCGRCPLDRHKMFRLMGDRVGLLWIGERSYPTPADWMREALALGASRRIPNVPRGFVAGKTWAWTAHRKGHARIEPELAAGAGLDPDWQPGVFHVFRSARIECVVDDDTSDDAIDDLLERGITPVRVERRTNWAHLGILDDFSKGGCDGQESGEAEETDDGDPDDE